jgi:hypothetical protein
MPNDPIPAYVAQKFNIARSPMGRDALIGRTNNGYFYRIIQLAHGGHKPRAYPLDSVAI